MIEPTIVAVWIGRFLLATFATVAAWWLLKRTGPWLLGLVARLDRRLKARGRGVSLVSVELISLDTILGIVQAGIGTLRYATMGLTAYAWLLVITYALDESHKVFDAVVQPLVRAVTSLGNAIVDFIPNLAMVIVIVILGRFAARTLTLLTAAIEEGRIEFPWLDRDLVAPTRRLAVIAVWLVALIMAVPYLPGSESKAFFGVGLAIAIIVSLGSTSATANLLGGLVLTYTRAFHVGDRVKIGELDGEITSLGAFSTRLRTSHDEELVIPNSIVQSGVVTNFSTNAQKGGVQVSISISLPYEIAWRKVHELLLVAAKHVDGVNQSPEPFVLQRALGDSGVLYELRAFTDRAHEIEFVVARLHQSVQDTFFNEGLEIAAPKLSATREARSLRVPDGRKNIKLERHASPSRAAPVKPAPLVRAPQASFVVVNKEDEAEPQKTEQSEEVEEKD